MSRHSTRYLIAAAVLASTLAGPRAYSQPALQQRLATAARLECSFSVIATGTWDGDTANATVGPATLEAAFFDIDVDEGTAEADSGFGASFISVRYAHGYLHLMQISDAGPLYITTVLARETAGGRLMAVHTRHEYSPAIVPGFTSRPEMYVGSCAVTS